MTGTEWTEPGKGHTARSLFTSLEMYAAWQLRVTAQKRGRALAAIRRLWLDDNPPTNLRLTGLPLTAEDVERIANAK